MKKLGEVIVLTASTEDVQEGEVEVRSEECQKYPVLQRY